MPIVRQVDRERGLDRTRLRPQAAGNFITFDKGGNIYGLLHEVTPGHYQKYVLYYSSYPTPYASHGEPPLKPGFFVIGVFSDPQLFYPADLPTITDPGQIKDAISPIENDQPLITTKVYLDGYREEDYPEVQTQPYLDGDASTKPCLTTPSQLVPGPIAIKEVFLKALVGNTGTIWINYRPNVAVNDGFSLEPGSVILLSITDLSRIYFLSTVAGDKIGFLYNI